MTAQGGALRSAWLRAPPQSRRAIFPMCYGSSYVAGDLADWLGSRGMTHIRGAPRHPQTQGKIERWHQMDLLRKSGELFS